jgi:hypothetical protein
MKFPGIYAGAPSIIGLCGHMGAGKDAAAALLSMLWYERISFADELKSEVAAAISDPSKIPSELPEYISSLILSCNREEVYAKPTSERMRVILQFWGTDFRRAQDPDYWVKLVSHRIQPGRKYVISDVRFANEAAMIREKGGVVWKIDRPVAINGIPGHASEQAIDSIEPDVVIYNHGTLLDMAQKLRGLVVAQ